MNMKNFTILIVSSAAILVSANVFAWRPVTLIINNQTSNKMTLIRPVQISEDKNVTVDPDFVDSIGPKTLQPYMFYFGDDLNQVISYRAEVSYYVECPNGSRDKFTIVAVGKTPPLKLGAPNFSFERSIADGQCSRIRAGNDVTHVRPGDSLEVVIVPKTEDQKK